MGMNVVAFFTSDGTPAINLSPVLSCWDLSDASVVLNSVAMSESAGGYYTYDFTTYNIAKDYGFRADGGASLSNQDRYQFSTNEISQISLGGGGGARDTYVIPGRKSPWTHKQRDTILEDTKETRGLLKEVSENIDKYHDEEIESISKSSNEIKLRIDETLESIVNIKKDMSNKKDSGNIIKKLNDTTKILIKYKDDLKPEIGMNDIDELKLRLDEIDTMITKILVSNMRDEDVDDLMENIKDKNNE